jgi:hypothetical protein
MTKNRSIEHPSGTAIWCPSGSLTTKTLLAKAAQGAHYFDFRSTKGMIPLMDLF